MMLQKKQATCSCQLNWARLSQLCLLLLLALGPSAPANSQGACASAKLICLIPNTILKGPNSQVSATYTLSPVTVSSKLQDSFAFLKADLGGELSQIPLASPASGIIFTIDPSLKVPVPSDQSLGPILTQRADTIGRHKLYVASTYQYFLLEDVDGLGLKGPLPVAFLLNAVPPSSNPPDAIAAGNSRVDLKIHQFVGYVTFGLTDSLDVSVALPLLRVDMRYSINEELFTANQPVQVFPNVTRDGQATGIGDVVLAFKEEAWKGKHGGFAYGTEVRLPTGDAKNFLGSGTFGIKPFVTLTRTGKISPHLNVGYQFNGNTELVTNSRGGKARLPERLLYSGGADWGIAKRLTIAADVLEQRVIDAKRASLSPDPITVQLGNTSFTVPRSLETNPGSYNRTDGSIGIKLKPFGNMLITGNLLVKLDRNGLRQRLAPLMGLSFTY